MADHGHHQAAVGLGGDTEMDCGVTRDDVGLVVVARVDLRKLAQRQYHGAHQQRQQGQVATLAFVTGVQLRAQGFHLGDVDLFHVGEVRNVPLRGLHLLGDLAPQADDRYGFLTVTLGIARVAAG